MLLQCCCAPCATAVINRLKNFDVTLFYYNPNTFPESEYQKRFETLKVYVDKAELGLNIVEIGYRNEDYLAAVSGFSDTTEGGPAPTARPSCTTRWERISGAPFGLVFLILAPWKK